MPIRCINSLSRVFQRLDLIQVLKINTKHLHLFIISNPQTMVKCLIRLGTIQKYSNYLYMVATIAYLTRSYLMKKLCTSPTKKSQSRVIIRNYSRNISKCTSHHPKLRIYSKGLFWQYRRDNTQFIINSAIKSSSNQQQSSTWHWCMNEMIALYLNCKL